MEANARCPPLTPKADNGLPSRRRSVGVRAFRMTLCGRDCKAKYSNSTIVGGVPHFDRLVVLAPQLPDKVYDSMHLSLDIIDTQQEGVALTQTLSTAVSGLRIWLHAVWPCWLGTRAAAPAAGVLDRGPSMVAVLLSETG